MKKTIFVLAACLLASTAALAQPGPRHGPGPGPGYDRGHHRPHKVWVPAHREHGRLVRGRYVWR